MKAEILLSCYASSRQVGHTNALINGAKNTDCIVIAATEQHARDLRNRLPGKKILTVSEKILGLRTPILVDHWALVNILTECCARVRFLEDQVTKLERERETFFEKIKRKILRKGKKK